jgi:ABC-type transport system involved in multi-copper enzyme maturation permease subunit
MKRLWRCLGVLLPILAIASPISFSLMLNETMIQPDLAIFVLPTVYITFIASVYIIIAALILNSIVLGKRITSDFFSRTAQLTLTLPVKREDLYMSKFINSIIWTTGANLCLFVTVILYMLFVPTPEKGHLVSTSAFDAVWAFFGLGVENSGIVFILTLILFIILLLQINLFTAVFLNYCVISSRSMGGIGKYFGVIFGGSAGLGIIIAIMSTGYGYLTAEMTMVQVKLVGMLILFAINVILAMINTAMFFSARDRLKYNFNMT